MKNIKFPFFLIFSILISLNASAGWIVTQRNYDSDEGEESAISETIYLQDNIMKVVQDQMVTIFNLNDETITIINPEKQIYWKGNVADYKVEIKSAMKSAMEEQLANASEEQKEMIKKMYQGMMESIDDPSKFAGEEPDEYNLEIERTGEKERIAGRMAVKYLISVNGTLKEVDWLSESDRANEEFDSEKFHNVFNDFISQAQSIAFYQTNEKYIEFSKKGFPLKSINYYGGYESISEVINLDKKHIDLSEFNVPAGYKKVDLVEIGLEEQK